MQEHYPFEPCPLKYETDALEPYIKKQTIELHHCVLHQGYADNLNNLLSGCPQYRGQNLCSLLTRPPAAASGVRVRILRNAGGLYCHNLYFGGLGCGVGFAYGRFLAAVECTFGTVENLHDALITRALRVFGSGWVWLVAEGKKLCLRTTQGHDVPSANLSSHIAVLDMWEHAYLLDYHADKEDYVRAWLQVIDYNVLEARYTRYLSGAY